MKFWAAIAAFFTAILSPIALWLKGRADQRRKQKVENLEAKVKALKAKDQVDEMDDDTRISELAKWMRERK